MNQYPRYVRRHIFAFSPLVISVRRVRKQRARIIRILKAKGAA